MASDAQALLLQVSADTSKAIKQLDNLSKKLSGVAKDAARTSKDASGSLDRFFGGRPDAEKALDKVFDATRFKVLDTGAARVGLFGSALEKLGPIGLGAAAAIGAVAVAGDQARKAMEWAEELQRTADKLGVTTGSLQEFDFAAVASSIGIEQGRQALEQFNQKIGSFEAHVRDRSMQRFADGIHLTRDEVQKTTDPVEKLRLVLEKISKLPNAQERASAADAFGLSGLLPIIQKGAPAIDNFIAKMREAQGAGGVVSEADIRKAAELQAKVNELTFIIGQQFKQTFIDAAPAVEAVASFLERCVKALADFASEVPQAIRGVQDLIDKLPHIPTGVHVDQQFLENEARAAGLGPAIDTGRLVGGGLQLLARRGRQANLRDLIQQHVIEGKPFDPNEIPQQPTRQGVGVQLFHDHGQTDQTAQLDSAAKQALDQARRAELQAEAQLAATVQARFALEAQALEAEKQGKLDELAKKEAEVRKSKNDAHKKEQIALLEKAKSEVENEYWAQLEILSRKTLVDEINNEQKLREHASQAHLAELKAQEDHLSALASVTNTEKARTELERAALKARQEQEDAQAQAAVDRAESELKVAKANNDQAAIIQAQNDLAAATAAQGRLGQQHQDENAVFAHAHRDPIKEFQDSLVDFDTFVKNEAVSSIKDLSSGLADAIVNAKNLGDVARNVFLKLIADLLQRELESAAAHFLPFLPGFASGTDYAPGGLALVGEKGPELVNLPRGSQVIPHNQTLQALSNMSLPRSGPPVTVIQSVSYELKGSVLTQDLLNQMQMMNVRTKAEATAQAVKIANRGAPSRLQNYSLLGT